MDIILTCLPNVETSETLLWEVVICDLANSDQVIVDHSTVDVKTSKDCYEYAQNKDVNFLDAPISGGPGGAADGTLTIMAGGKEEIFNKAKPAFEMMGKNITYGNKWRWNSYEISKSTLSAQTQLLLPKHLFLQSKQV